jgi:hypothetical protein
LLGLYDEDDTRISVERWWNDVDGGEPQYAALPLCLPELSHGLAWPGVELGPLPVPRVRQQFGVQHNFCVAVAFCLEQDSGCVVS